MESIKILDCTLRDGGYYNKWDFDIGLVNQYLEAMSQASVDYVELGLRNFEKNGYLGPYAYSTEAFLSTLDLPSNLKYGVMIDAKTILTSEYPVEDALSYLFLDAESSLVDLVRVAAHFNEVSECGELVRILKRKGYTVGFNLMQSGGKSSELIESKVNEIKQWGVVDVLYFADSLGNMSNIEIDRIMTSIRSVWKGNVGIHAHDNMDNGLDNTMYAIQRGVTWVDGTVLGMGRGAGNAKLENILLSLKGNKACHKLLNRLALGEFSQMKSAYGWGSNICYFLAALNNIHPTYVQNLLADERYEIDNVLEIIEYLSGIPNVNSFNEVVLNKAARFSKKEIEIYDECALLNQFEHKEVLVIASGATIDTHCVGIRQYIERNNPIVISVNIEKNSQYDDLVDYYCSTHNVRFSKDKKLYSSINKPIVLPQNRFNESIDKLNIGSYISYGLYTDENASVTIGDKWCVLPYELTIGYAISLAIASGSLNISLVGIDGYKDDHIRNNEMVALLNGIKMCRPEVQIRALTPTIYSIDEGSVYAPVI